MQKALTAVSYHWILGRLENTPTCVEATSQQKGEDPYPHIDEATPFYACDSKETFYLRGDHLRLTNVTGNWGAFVSSSNCYLTCMQTAEENAVTTG